MGKKRRLNSAKAKFASKHAAHPRMKALTTEEEEEIQELPVPVVEFKAEGVAVEVKLEVVQPGSPDRRPEETMAKVTVKAKTATTRKKKKAITSAKKTRSRATKRKITSATA